jgi:hypothetical protein
MKNEGMDEWLARLRRMPLRRQEATADDLDFGRVAKGYQRLDYARRVRAYKSGKNRWHGKPRRPWSAGLETQFLVILFNWLINGSGTGDWNEDSKLAGRLWMQEAEHARAHAKDDGEYDLPSQNFGYDLLAKLVALAVNGPSDQSRSVWEPVLSHGPAAHYALRHFAQGLFTQLHSGLRPSTPLLCARALVDFDARSHIHKAIPACQP